MPNVDEDFLLRVLDLCAPAPLYPVRYARQANVDRLKLDGALDELRRRGLVKFTEWVKDSGQGYQATDLGLQTLAAKRLPTGSPLAPTPSAPASGAGVSLYERGETVRGALLAPRKPYVTGTLLFLNFLFFAGGAVLVWWHDLSVLAYFKGNAQTSRHVPVLYELGALFPPVTIPEHDRRRPELERIVLFLFLHVGVWHLLLNMGFLAVLGRDIEAMWGPARFLAIYLIAGVVSACAVIFISRLDGFRSHEVPITVGASGPLYGLFTAMVVWFSLNHEHLPDNLLQEWSQTIGVSLILLVASSFVPSVSWQGHFGGAVGGLLSGLLLHWSRFSPSALVRRLALTLVPLVPAAFLGAVFWQAGYF